MIKKDFTILVLEDEHPLLEAIKIKLENVGLNVVTARTVIQGLNYLDELVKVDGIWLDHYLMGKESGLDFVAKVKQPDSKWRSVPIFVVSNTASDDKVNAYLRFGVDKYYIKTNYRLSEIVQEIITYLQEEKRV